MGPTESVLVVDDTEEDLLFTSGLLRRDGFTVDTVSSGPGACEILAARPFDLVLTDLVMRGATGFDVIRQAHQANPEVICIAMTSFGSLDGAMDALRLGAYSYLLKPCDEGVVRHTIRLGLEKQRLAKALRHRNQELETLNRELDQRVQKAVAELSALNRRILTEMASLREVDEMKSSFLDNVSHDLRAPLTTIKSYIGLVLDEGGALSVEQQDFLTKAKKSVLHMEYLIGQLVNAASLTSGMVKLNRQEFMLGELVDEAVAMSAPHAKASGIKLSADCGTTAAATLSADRGQLLQVLSNLVGNACKFTPSGGVVTLTAGVDEKTVRFRVEDTGPGIAAQHLPRIFDRFYQVNSSTTLTSFKGLGLGLRIVKEIVALHGGRIWVESELGRGSRFFVELPRRPAA